MRRLLAFLLYMPAACDDISPWVIVEHDSLAGFACADAWSRGDEIWAIGQRYTQGRATVAHFDGTDWRHLPYVPTQATSVWASAADDVWAGGEALHRWDGSGWSTLDLATITGYQTHAVVDIWGSDAADVWFIVDDLDDESRFPSHVWRFDGETWTESVADFAALVGVQDRSDEMIAVRLLGGCGGSTGESWVSARKKFYLDAAIHVLRGTGGVWDEASPDYVYSNEGGVGALACNGEHVWGAGSSFPHDWEHSIARWVGDAWREAAVPFDVGHFEAAWATSDGEAWIIGHQHLHAGDLARQIVYVSGDKATGTGGPNLPEVTEIVSTESDRTFAFGDGVVLEYSSTPWLPGAR